MQFKDTDLYLDLQIPVVVDMNQYKIQVSKKSFYLNIILYPLSHSELGSNFYLTRVLIRNTPPTANTFTNNIKTDNNNNNNDATQLVYPGWSRVMLKSLAKINNNDTNASLQWLVALTSLQLVQSDHKRLNDCEKDNTNVFLHLFQ
jgi:hypothetical protein